jgi:hypothetical protein
MRYPYSLFQIKLVSIEQPFILTSLIFKLRPKCSLALIKIYLWMDCLWPIWLKSTHMIMNFKLVSFYFSSYMYCLWCCGLITPLFIELTDSMYKLDILNVVIFNFIFITGWWDLLYVMSFPKHNIFFCVLFHISWVWFIHSYVIALSLNCRL